MENKSQSDVPTFYIYKDDTGAFCRTNEELTKKLNYISAANELVITREYFPQWPEPAYKSQLRPAWKITTDGSRVMRWYLRRCPHTPKHGNRCRMVNDKECARTCAIYLRWDEKTGLWVQAPLIDKLEE